MHTQGMRAKTDYISAGDAQFCITCLAAHVRLESFADVGASKGALWVRKPKGQGETAEARKRMLHMYT